MKAIKRLAALLLAVSFLLGLGVLGASAAEVAFPSDATPTKVYLEGKEVLAGECVIVNSITYVPLRNFCNLFADCAISWNGQSKTATVKTEHLYMTVQEDAVYIVANERYLYTVGSVRNFGGHLYVPIRPLALAFAEALTWNAEAHCVELTAAGMGNTRAIAAADYKSDEVYWLSRIISAEAKGEPIEGQIAVGNVVLNRMRHAAYPNTIYGVIFDRKHGTQFSPVAFGTIYQAPTASAIAAAKLCLEGYSISNTALFFVNPRIATSSWIQQNRKFEFTIGNHDFYR